MQDHPYETVLVSGASRGIGRAIALRLASRGLRCFLLGRDRDALKEVATACERSGGTADYLPGDLSDPEYILAAVSAAEASLGAIEVLVNNAGRAAHSPVQSADLDAWRAVLELNFSTVMTLIRHISPSMVEQRRGAIINISSISGRTAAAGSAIYAATKHALNGFSGCLYEDVRDYGVKVSTIMPGFVDTALTAELGLNQTKMIQPDDIADAVDYVLGASVSCCPTEIVIRPQSRP